MTSRFSPAAATSSRNPLPLKRYFAGQGDGFGSAARAFAKTGPARKSAIGGSPATGRASLSTPSSGMQTSSQTSQKAFAVRVTSSPGRASFGTDIGTRWIASPL